MAKQDNPLVVRKAPSADDAVMADVVHRLVDVYRPERVYLFGSVGRGDANADSDYDILLVARDDSPEFLRDGRRGYKVIADFPISVDLGLWPRDVVFLWETTPLRSWLAAESCTPPAASTTGYL